MTLPMDDAGLPLPGRELDAWIWENVFHNIVLRNDDGEIIGFVDILATPEAGEIYPEVPFSTTSAFFQVIEAMGRYWKFEEFENAFLASFQLHQENGWKWISVSLPPIGNYPDREHAYAHAVCCCAWKTEQKGENNDSN